MSRHMEIRHAFLHAPSLKDLEIKFLGQTQYILFADGETIPPLKSLALDGYMIGRGPPEKQLQQRMQLGALRDLTLRNCDNDKTSCF